MDPNNFTPDVLAYILAACDSVGMSLPEQEQLQCWESLCSVVGTINAETMVQRAKLGRHAFCEDLFQNLP